MAVNRHFEDMDTSVAYEQYRFRYEGTGIAEDIVSHLYRKLSKETGSLALDVGCGTGFMTRVLAPHFSKVIGLDCSSSQIKVALDNTKETNVTYMLGAAEDLGFIPGGSVDLITAAVALHWFDTERFFAEVDRVLKPGGCLAIVAPGYTKSGDIMGVLSVDTENELVSQRCRLLFQKIVIDHVQPNVGKMSQKMIKDKMFPLPAYTEKHYFRVDAEMSGDIKMFVGYLKSLGTVFRAGDGGSSDSMLEFYKQRLLQILGEISPAPETVRMKLGNVIHCLIYRKPCD